MKFILSKMKTAIVLLLITLAFLEIFMSVIARPISYGMPYYNETVYEDGSRFDATVTFHRNGTAVVENDNYEEPVSVPFYYTNGYTFFLLGETAEDRVAEIKYIEENFEEAKATPSYGYTINAFVYSPREGDLREVYACKGLFVFAVSGLIALVVLAALTCAAFILATRHKNETRVITIIETPEVGPEGVLYKVGTTDADGEENKEENK